MSNNEVQISKFLSLVLRHQPEQIGIQPDSNGWVDINDLIAKANNHGVKLDRALLTHLVATNSKKRFAIDEKLHRIRASQGHSIAIELGLENKRPPAILYHGTSKASVPSILQTGLEKRSRQHVHLSSDIDTAIRVGQRHGKPVVFEVMAEVMYNDNFHFFLSDNEVWLTDHVPSNYLKIVE